MCCSSLSDLAHAMGITPNEAVALPTVISRASVSANMDEGKMIALANESGDIRDYLAGICRQVT